jgi:hypothetical protein
VIGNGESVVGASTRTRQSDLGVCSSLDKIRYCYEVSTYEFLPT